MANYHKLSEVQGGLASWGKRDEDYNPDEKLETRLQFKHDEDEIIYSKAFRRLSDKSQIVVRPESQDHFRSRLTHTLEVNQIAESIGNGLGLNQDLVHAIALGHDIGHCPFGHAGERAIQKIIKQEILELCNKETLITELKNHYSTKYEIPDENFLDDSGSLKDCWLFHHAINSVRITQRKMNNITDLCQDGILKHSWSPWQENPRFGIPQTLEGQAVALADQIAGINHDTEDILSCEHSECDRDKLITELPDYMSRTINETQNEIRRNFLSWFLPDAAKTPEKGWGRKSRLQKLIHEAFTESRDSLLSKDESIKPPELKLTMSNETTNYLAAYENYVRNEIIRGVPWFRHRDAMAESVITSVYNFLKYYIDGCRIEDPGHPDFEWEANERISECRKSVRNDVNGYLSDSHFEIFCNSGINRESGQKIYEDLRTMDYIAGMTDKRIMDVHKVALQLFE